MKSPKPLGFFLLAASLLTTGLVSGCASGDDTVSLQAATRPATQPSTRAALSNDADEIEVVEMEPGDDMLKYAPEPVRDAFMSEFPDAEVMEMEMQVDELGEEAYYIGFYDGRGIHPQKRHSFRRVRFNRRGGIWNKRSRFKSRRYYRGYGRGFSRGRGGRRR
ncbi:MAG: hypothetical protein AAGD32_04205 [Planctomycetota bacterium]